MISNQLASKLLSRLWHGADYNYEQWLDRPDVLTDDFRLMQAAHCNIMSVGIFSWAMLEPEEGRYDFSWMDRLLDSLAENNIGAALATPSAAPPAWLSQKYPETRRMNALSLREPHRQRQNFCYTSPIYREKCAAINTRLAQRYGNHPALVLWHVSNEYGASQCHCDLCYGAFRDWLKARYGTLDALNQAWWSTFWSHRYTSWDQIEPVDPSMHGLMLDWQRFISDQGLDFMRAEAAPLRAITPYIPLTTNFMQPDVGLNYAQWAKHVDVISWDSYPRWHLTDDVSTAMQTAFYHDLYRSYKQQPFLLMESSPSVTNWQGVSRLKKPGFLKLASLQAVAHGSNSVQYFQWRQSRGGEEKFHGAVVSHLGSEKTRVFQDVAEVGQVLEQLAALSETRVEAQVAIIYDFENEWALNHAKLPRSLEKNYQQTCRTHYAPFWKQGVAVDVISVEAEFSPYRILIAPMLYMMKDGVAERIEQFVQAGGIFITTYLSGLVDESDLCFLNGYPSALRRTLGLYSEEMDTLADEQSGTLVACADNPLNLTGTYTFHHYAELVQIETARIVAAYASDFYAGMPALTVNHHGAGHAYYIAPRTDDAFLNDFYACLIDQAGLAEKIFTAPSGVSIQKRSSADASYWFVMNFTAEDQTVPVHEAVQEVLTQTAVGDSISLSAYGISIVVQNK